MFTKADLAADVLKQLQCGKFVPTTEHFWKNVEENVDAREHMRKQTQCEVCVRGALFLAALERKNNLNTDDIDCDVFTESRYLEVFAPKEILEIEAFFELYSGRFVHRDGPNFVEHDLEAKYYLNVWCAEKEDRMRLIMENIVKYGTFDRKKFIDDNPV